MVQYGTIYGSEYGKPEIIDGPYYGQPEIIYGPEYGLPEIIYGPEYGRPEIIYAPEYGLPEIMKTQEFNYNQKNVGHGNHLCTKCTRICCQGPYAVFLGRHSAREIHSIALDETHDKNVASFGSQK